MRSRGRIIQIGLFVLAAALLAAAGLLQTHMRDPASSTDAGAMDAAVLEAHPEVALLTTAFGGLRVLGANYLWIRSQQEHQAGRHYDAYQLADLICRLQPHFPGVWAFQAWNMAWNISVQTHTREQRWQWVYNGVKLLRDRGIPLNPRSLILYKELAWIFFSKIGGQLDDMHWSYKERWAGQMQRLLGAPPYEFQLSRTLAQETDVVIEAFVPVAEAPLDKDPRRQGEETIQADQRDVLLRDPAVRAYAEKLAPLGVAVDATLLDAYNRLSQDYAAQAVRVLPPDVELKNRRDRLMRDAKIPAAELKQQLDQIDRDEALLKVINDPSAAAPRAKMLAFVRAQILWNEYRMDPAFMLKLMRRYQVPLDWRHAMSHGLYWAAYGDEACGSTNLTGIDALNNRRTVLNSLKSLTFTGLVNLQDRPEQPAYPVYFESADLRYIQPTNKQHEEYIDLLCQVNQRPFEDNFLSSGHANYLIDAINLLTADGRIVGPDGKATPGTAQFYYDYLKEKYHRKGGKWDHVSVEDFVVDNIQEEQGGLRYTVVLQILQYTLKRAYLARGLYGDQRTYAARYGYAKRVYDAYQAKAVDRMKLPSFVDLSSAVLTALLGGPRNLGVDLTLSQRSDIYLSMRDQPDLQVRAYHSLERLLGLMCNLEGFDMQQAFPAPPGLEAYRQSLQRRFEQSPEDRKIPR